MARALGNWLAYFRSYFDYEITETDREVTIVITGGMNNKGNYNPGGQKIEQHLEVTGFETFSQIKAQSNSNTNSYYPKMDPRTYTWQKASAIQDITIRYSMEVQGTDKTPGVSIATLDLTVPAKQGGMYIGIDGVAKRIIKGYIGVDGIAREISTVYVGVDGIARKA